MESFNSFLFCCGAKLRLTIPFNILPVTISFLLSFVSVVDVVSSELPFGSA